MIEVHDTLLAAHIPKLADVVIAGSGPAGRAGGADCCGPDIVRVALKPEVLLAYCHIPPAHLHRDMTAASDHMAMCNFCKQSVHSRQMQPCIAIACSVCARHHGAAGSLAEACGAHGRVCQHHSDRFISSPALILGLNSNCDLGLIILVNC